MKLLSPAGNFESLKSAVYNGADEVYLGVNQFNARNNVDGFTAENLKDAVSFAHLFDVKVNLAINILFSDNELQSAVDLVVNAYNDGVDSFIIQDLGLAKILHDNYPEIQLHASTQMGIHNLEGVRAILPYGFTRVVLSRETPLDEIKRIKDNVNIEIEYFVQGALCVSFSGNCYMISMLFNASGNRGRCKQLCRLPFTMEVDGKKIKDGYLLSAKDINMTDRLLDLEKSGVDVLKIEGRARRPEYVSMVTSEYRKALDGKPFSKENIKLAFNREYTAGYLDGNANIISDYNNHIGIAVGKIERIESGKKFNKIFISSNRELTPKSTFKTFSGRKETAVVTAYDLNNTDKNKYVFTTTQNLKVGDIVRLIVDSELEQKYLQNELKRQVDIDLYLQAGKPIKAEISIYGKEIVVLGNVCQTALNRPLEKEQIALNFKKSKTFDAILDFKAFEPVFMPVKDINEFRRKVFERIEEIIVNAHKRNVRLLKVELPKKRLELFKYDFEYSVFSPEEYKLEEIFRFVKECEKSNKKPYLDTPNFALRSDIELLKEIVQKTEIGVVANNYYALELGTNNLLIGAGLNVYNSVSASILNKPIIGSEIDVETFDYPYMTLRHCPIKAHLNGNCNDCRYSDKISYTLEGKGKFKLRRKKLSSCTFYLAK